MYDIYFIVHNFKNILTLDFVGRLKEFVANNDALFDRFEDAYNEDLLGNTKIELDALILSLYEKINT